MSVLGEVALVIGCVVVGTIVVPIVLFACLWVIGLLASPAIMLFEGSTDHIKEAFGGPWPDSRRDRERLARRTAAEMAAADKWTAGARRG